MKSKPRQPAEDVPLVLVTYSLGGSDHFAFLMGDLLYDCYNIHHGLPRTAVQFLAHERAYELLLRFMHTILAYGDDPRYTEFAGKLEDAVDVRLVIWEGME